MWRFLQGRIRKSHSPEVQHLHPKHASIPCFAGGRMGRSILTLLRGCAPLVLGDTCPVWCPKVFRVLRPNCSSQEHQQQTTETSFPLIPFSNHLSNVLLFKQSQAAQEVHAQPTAFRRASSKFCPFSFLFPYDPIFPPSSSSPMQKTAMARKMPEAAVLLP